MALMNTDIRLTAGDFYRRNDCTSKIFPTKIVHAHTNSAPDIQMNDWYSESCADTMLVAKKNYDGKAIITDLMATGASQ